MNYKYLFFALLLLLSSTIAYVMIIYSLDKQADISVSVSEDGGKTWGKPLTHVSGDVGKQVHPVRTITVGGVSFNMIWVEGGTFTMGATSEQGSDAESKEKPAHRVTLTDYYIGQTEVTQALWQAVMGSNPSSNQGDNLPVETVSWDDCQTFIRKLNSLTGLRFALPTEAQWEYAARGGKQSQGYKYAGSHSVEQVAWYDGNSSYETHAVATKQPNELGLYDMSGNVWEWCHDWFGSYSSAAQTNPTWVSYGSGRVGRGGSCYFNASCCRVSFRDFYTPSNRNFIIGLRLVLLVSEDGGTTWSQPLRQVTGDVGKQVHPVRTITVGGVSFKMIWVEGGTFTMGATSEQGRDAQDDEKPAHRVTLTDYYIGQTEVTQALWKAVMGSNPSDHQGDDLPVDLVSWDDCQTFIRKLNSLTGLRFALPTEAQWEYAARGGKQSQGYKYAGSNALGQVAWFYGNSRDRMHAVATKQPNELGLYDMSGNVTEWCQDWKGDYSSAAQTNPTGASSGSLRVRRGGSCFYYAMGCRVSNRNDGAPSFRFINHGLRLVLLP